MTGSNLEAGPDVPHPAVIQEAVAYAMQAIGGKWKLKIIFALFEEKKDLTG